MRFIVFIYGEVIYYIHPEIGYLSRSTFKCIEYFYLLPLSISFFDRIDYVLTISEEGLVINIFERYLHSYISDYLSTIRTLFYELSRISNHLLAITTHGIDIGSLNSMLLAFEEREKIHNLHEYIAGSRIYGSLLSIYCIRYDINFRFLTYIFDLIINLPFINKEIHAILSFSSIFISRLFLIGLIDLDTIIGCSISGVLSRCVGYYIDSRITCYDFYSRLSYIIGIG